MSPTRSIPTWLSVFMLAACGSDADPLGAAQLGEEAEPVAADDAGTDAPSVVLWSEVEPIKSVDDALPNVFIQPYVDCREPLPSDEPGMGPEGKVCTPVSIAGCTEPGKYYGDYADCDVVRTQRPFWPAAPANQPQTDDPRLANPAFMQELAWVTEQLEASACVCCHDSNNQGKAAQWDIGLGPIWTDTISDSGLALFTGVADSRALGAYPAKDNNGFDRSVTGVPTTDIPRMKAFFDAELLRRGITAEELAEVDPFGGPVYRSLTTKPEPCGPGRGIEADGTVNIDGFPARYVYLLEAGSDNPGVPPNLDLPKGTLWRLDVRADAQPVVSGIKYGQTPEGTFQRVPSAGAAPALQDGKTYHLYALYDVGIASVNCLFTFNGK